jgi:TRAP-type C4-dicarboxylate transport system substrate-binding protein
MQNRVVDGIVSQWTAFAPFKLQEVTKYHVDIPLGSSATFIAFNNDAWKELPEAAKKVVMNHAGEKMARSLGKFWDHVSEVAKEQALKAPGHQLVTFSPAETEKFYKTIEPAYEEWRKSTPGGDALIKAYKAEYEAASKGMM